MPTEIYKCLVWFVFGLLNFVTDVRCFFGDTWFIVIIFHKSKIFTNSKEYCYFPMPDVWLIIQKSPNCYSKWLYFVNNFSHLPRGQAINSKITCYIWTYSEHNYDNYMEFSVLSLLNLCPSNRISHFNR